ncbi:hypothetical protein GQF61_04310 [Sphingobacterium sp. DK4209]|uniref:Uncharacterized protein n=1 Tax=Sphingobacterium zhuxiongii TaxID=2662364 RepID=A0A5Q0QEN9_9SPHI|nr:MULTISPECIES: hypothetical protein [unclassified Sphingobacterium]MVZ65063.1 hypothetical protein [Sphingobacterium sp. DK4209]QGA26012.1 hypothetical protein GFH32_06640 [Sphingobacterium sp. dk4302]
MTLLISASFYYNQNYIEKYLCIQRDMENNSCHGQCYLAKKLKAQQEQEQQNFKMNLHEACTLQIFSFSFKSPTYSELNSSDYAIFKSNLNPKDISIGLLRPPLV